LSGDWRAVADTWRVKQLSYTWLRSLMGHYADFWQVTGDALDFALAARGISNAPLRARLMECYLSLRAYPEVVQVLQRLKKANKRTAILSNGTPKMLAAAVRSAGLDDYFDAVYSVDSLRIYKPDPRVYGLAIDGLGVPAGAISFQSSNAWDAHAAQACGLHAVWCNRTGQTRERLPEPPAVEIVTLVDLPAIVGAA
jgi:2-haloacid dehalogenase